jgi:aspartate/methionine/tyrosine aminotransferase
MTADLSQAQRIAGIQPFQVMELLARARELEAQGRDIVHMEIGEPDFPTPQPVIDAGMRAIATGNLFYTPALGLPELRQAIADYYRTRYGISISAERIIVTSGSSGALLLACMLLVNPGDRVLMADPGYPCNCNFVRAVNGEPVGVPVDAWTNYQLTSGLVASHWRERAVAVIAASPSNPTGTMMPAEELRAMAALARERNAALIVDEIYHGLTYEGDCPTALEFADDVFVLNSFSKYFNMTGWRLGWLVAPQQHVRAIDKLSQNIYLSAPTPSQYAALAAFLPETIAILETRRAEFKARRDYLVPALRKTGFDIARMPQGAFYVYADCSRHTADSFAFSRELLETAGVAITPGMDFGANQPQRYVRFAYTNSVERLSEGVRRIERFLAGQRGAGSKR